MANEPDITRPTADACAQADMWATEDPAYAENMATLTDLGGALQEQDIDERESRRLISRSIALERVMQREYDSKWALWCAQNMRPMGVE